ncbi:MAG: hypothetical protein HZA66_17635 [Rhodopseudomonas palustris]|uniref:Uncharacterized protein n=1 Tax=Rhodopseudomonas palustris TaxID=1076 RepID=A0A933RZE9_RHOPL|nr:hypothetical protein [Rhodopseudomonas palustris]
MEEIAPKAVAEAWNYARSSVSDAVEKHDRRGFRLLQWAPLRVELGSKPTELSLEHEARLRSRAHDSIPALQKFLAAREGQRLFDVRSEDDDLVVRRVERKPGSQSVDRYWDVDGALSGGWINRMFTFRERMKTSSFMTWSSDAADARAHNLELPPTAYGNTSIVARLEFNWLDSLQLGSQDVDRLSATGQGSSRHPLMIAMRALALQPPGKLEPAMEHTTFREKYSLRTISGPGGNEQELFQLNIDHMTVQSLRSGHFAQHRDVDIAPSVLVDSQILSRLTHIATTLSDRFGLEPALATKAWWGAAALGELPGQ